MRRVCEVDVLLCSRCGGRRPNFFLHRARREGFSLNANVDLGGVRVLERADDGHSPFAG